MRLEFKILWFENQPQDVRTQVEEIEEHLQAVGFIPKVKMVLDGTDVEAFGQEQELYDEYDLVVVDYDLGHPGKNGDWVAQKIRRHFGFTDIIFYSGKKPGDLRQLVQAGGIDGVYCFNRPELSEKLAKHIDQVMRRLSRLEAMRGLAMGVVGRCDDEFRSLILHSFEKMEGEKRDLLERTLEELILSSRETSQRGFDSCINFHEKLHSRAVTSFTLYKLALHVLKGNPRCADVRQLLTEYNAKVLEPRNRLAHAVESRTANGWVVQSDSKPELTIDDFPALRNDLAAHLANVHNISLLIRSDALGGNL